MKKILTLFALLCCLYSAQAQNRVDNLFFEARGGFADEFTSKNNSNHFTGDFFNFQANGHLSDKISYRIRQRLTKNPFDQDNILNGTDFLYIDWRINPKWSLTIGKQEIYIGGFEYDYAPIDVYYWSGFCNNLPQSYGMGVSLGFHFDSNNTLYFQIINSPYSLGNNDDYLSYNLAWFGQIAPFWKTIWSANYAEAANSNGLFLFASGNRFQIADFYLEADFTESILETRNDTKCAFSVVGKLNYNYKDKLNAFVKGGYDDNILSYDNNAENVFLYHKNYSFIGGGVEFFPLENKDLRLHCVYYYNDSDKIHNLNIGATWKLDVISRK